MTALLLLCLRQSFSHLFEAKVNRIYIYTQLPDCETYIVPNKEVSISERK